MYMYVQCIIGPHFTISVKLKKIQEKMKLKQISHDCILKRKCNRHKSLSGKTYYHAVYVPIGWVEVVAKTLLRSVLEVQLVACCHVSPDQIKCPGTEYQWLISYCVIILHEHCNCNLLSCLYSWMCISLKDKLTVHWLHVHVTLTACCKDVEIFLSLSVFYRTWRQWRF